MVLGSSTIYLGRWYESQVVQSILLWRAKNKTQCGASGHPTWEWPPYSHGSATRIDTYKCKDLDLCHVGINYLVLCAWEEKSPLLPSPKWDHPHLVQFYIKASFEFTWLKDPNEEPSARTNILCVMFQAQPQAIPKALPGSPHRGKLPFPHQLLCTE